MQTNGQMSYTQFRFALVDEVLTSKLTPVQVATRLEVMKATFPQIEWDEIQRYKRAGDDWREVIL